MLTNYNKISSIRTLIKGTLLMFIGLSQFIISSCSKEEEDMKYPPVFTSSEIKSITSSTVSLSSFVVNFGNDKVFERGVCWDINATPTISDNKTSDGVGDGDHTSTISSLIPNIQYNVRAYAANNAGTAYGSEYRVKTLPDDLDTQKDAINIISVSPVTELIDDQFYPFNITVFYKLNSLETGTLRIGFNNTDDIKAFRIVSDWKKVINKGNGLYTFNVATTVKDWGSKGEFMAYVNLSENPTPSNWTPLATDIFVLIPKK